MGTIVNCARTAALGLGIQGALAACGPAAGVAGHSYQPSSASVAHADADAGADGAPLCLDEATRIATPRGEIPVTEVKVGTIVESRSPKGERVRVRVAKIGATVAPPGHDLVAITLRDGRGFRASGGHPTSAGRTVGGLHVGEFYEGSAIVSKRREAYAGPKTYDLLPEGPTGIYFANGVALKSTLRAGAKRIEPPRVLAK